MVRAIRDLSKLPKHAYYTSILFRRQTPGSPGSFLAPPFTPSLDTVLDPKHPAARLLRKYKKILPEWRIPSLGVKLVPTALLAQPEHRLVGPFERPFTTWEEKIGAARKEGLGVRMLRDRKGKESSVIVDKEGSPLDPTLQVQIGPEFAPDRHLTPTRVSVFPKVSEAGCDTTTKVSLLRTLAIQKLARRIPMSYCTATSKGRMGAARHLRARETQLIKTCLDLIVTRGAYVVGGEEPKKQPTRKEGGKGVGKENKDAVEEKPAGEHENESKPAKPKILFNVDEASQPPQRWVMQGWTYIFFPSIEMYRMPYTTLIPLLREAMQLLYKRANELERGWLAQALLEGEGRKGLKEVGVGGKGGRIAAVAEGVEQDDVDVGQRHSQDTQDIPTPTPAPTVRPVAEPSGKRKLTYVPIPGYAPPRTFDSEAWAERVRDGLLRMRMTIQDQDNEKGGKGKGTAR